MEESIDLVYGAADVTMPLAGYPLADVRDAVQTTLNIPQRALAYIGGAPVLGEYTLLPGDRVEFLLLCGQKGGGDEVQIKPRPQQFSLFPKHSTKELESYRELLESGLLVPEVVVDQEGYILDGQAGWEIAQELGLECKYRLRTFENETDKLEFIVLRNCPRRNLTGDQKRQVIENYLLLDPAISNKHLADLLLVSQGIVADVRDGLVSCSRIEKLDKHRGKDGRHRKARYKNVLADSEKAVVKALGLLKHLPDAALGKTLDIVSAGKLASRNKAKTQRQERINALPPLSREQLIAEAQLFHCGFTQLRRTARLRKGSANLVLLDPPYDETWVRHNWWDLAGTAFDLLRNGGIVVAYTGRYNWLHVGNSMMDNGLTPPVLLRCRYVAPINSHAGHMLTAGEPVLLATKGTPDWPQGFTDEFQSTGREKDWHEWQKPLPDIRRLVEWFSRPGDLVVDLAAGSFTTAVACVELGRRFIGCDESEDCVRIGEQRMREALGAIDKPAGDTQ